MKASLLLCLLTEQNLIFIMSLENALAGETVSPHVRKMRSALSNITLFVAYQESRLQKMYVPDAL